MRVFQPGLTGRAWCLALLLACQTACADDTLKEKFNKKYSEFLSQNSQSLLPLPEINKSDWLKIRQTRPMNRIYTDPDRFYNNKIYTFTLFFAADDGTYYLNVKGGFWGMDELIYGPLSLQHLQ